MEYAYGLIRSVKYFYNEMNSATLTGAIDVIVVEWPDGSLRASPFHVRFGKYGVLHSREKVVEIEINGEPVALRMKLGETGEAFFVDPLDSYEDIDSLPSNLATSPLPPQKNGAELMSEGVASLRRGSTFPDPPDASSLHGQLGGGPAAGTVPTVRPDLLGLSQGMPSCTASTSALDQLRHKCETDLSNLPDDCTSKSDDADDADDECEELLTPIVGASENVDIFEQNNSKQRRKNRRQQRSQTSIHFPPIKSRRQTPLQTPTTSNQHQIANGNPAKIQEVGTEPSENPNLCKFGVNGGVATTCTSDVELSPFHRREPSPGPLSDSEVDRVVRKESVKIEVLGVEATDWPWGELPQSEVTTPVAHENVNSSGGNRDAVKDGEGGQVALDMDKLSVDSLTPPDSPGKPLNKTSPANASTSSVSGWLFRSWTAPNSNSTNATNSNENTELSNSAENVTQNAESATVVNKESDGIYLDDLIESQNNPDVLDRYLNIKRSDETSAQNADAIHNCALSMCGFRPDLNQAEFDARKVTFDMFLADPLAYMDSEDLVLRMGERYYPRRAAVAVLMSLVAYRQPLPHSTVRRLVSQAMGESESTPATPAPGETAGAGGISSWFTWRRAPSLEKDESGARADERSETPQPASSEPDITKPNIILHEKSAPIPINAVGSINSETLVNSTDATQEVLLADDGGVRRFKRSLRLSDTQLKALHLRVGPNEARFTVTTKFQGTAWCACQIFLYKWSDKLVVSDIDGTITKSDVLGQVLPVVGANQWAQAGVVRLFNRIVANGYKIIYLSSRAIGQSHYTKSYLRSIEQENVGLPNGPVLLNPTSLLSAFHKEVIERRPEDFKCAALRDVHALFPEQLNPFYAGFGNRVNDVIAYRAVEIPLARILTINPKGEVRRADSIGFVSSYQGMTHDIADYIFPPLNENDKTAFSRPFTHSAFAHWHQAPTNIDDYLLGDYEKRRKESELENVKKEKGKK